LGLREDLPEEIELLVWCGVSVNSLYSYPSLGRRARVRFQMRNAVKTITKRFGDLLAFGEAGYSIKTSGSILFQVDID
jgi:hypothetical protein